MRAGWQPREPGLALNGQFVPTDAVAVGLRCPIGDRTLKCFGIQSACWLGNGGKHGDDRDHFEEGEAGLRPHGYRWP